MIQPIDIKTQNFKKGLMGYKPSDVDMFKDMVYHAYDELHKEYIATSEKLEKINASLQEKNVKIYELESKLQQYEGKGAKSSESKASASTTKVEPKKETTNTNKTSASSKFFKKSDEAAPATSADDEEIFVGEIEEARKSDRMMIGDGEEEEDMDFEFL